MQQDQASSAPGGRQPPGGGPPPGGSNDQQLRQALAKIKQFEILMQRLEKERSEFRSRALMAETQNKALQEHLNK